MKVLIKGSFALLCALLCIIIVPQTLLAAEEVEAMESDMSEVTAHDYIMDKQQTSNCSMVRMTDEELSEVTAAGFSNFTLQDNVVKAYFNVEAQTFTEIQSLKMGYYNNGSGLGWDEDWTNVSLGSSTEPLKLKGLYIEASFSDITNATGNRTLNCIRIGTPSMTGPITANFNSFSGCVKTAGVTDPVVYQSRGPINSGQLTTIYSNPGHDNNNSEFFMQLSLAGTPATSTVPAAPAGWWFFWSNATVTLAM